MLPPKIRVLVIMLDFGENKMPSSHLTIKSVSAGHDWLPKQMRTATSRV